MFDREDAVFDAVVDAVVDRVDRLDAVVAVEAGAVEDWADALLALAAGFDVTTGLSASLCQLPFSSKEPTAAVFISTGISPAVFAGFVSALVASTRECVSFAIRIA